MTTGVKNLGDTTLRLQGVNESEPLAIQFFNVFSQVPQARDNPLKGMGIMEHPISGKSLQVPVKQGVLTVRDQPVGSDRTLKGVGTNAPRKSIEWEPKALETFVEDGETEQNQLAWVEDSMGDVMAAMNRKEVQVCIDALNRVPTTDIGEQGSAAFAVDVRTKRDGSAYGQGARVTTGDAANWNYQKAARARSLAYRANLGMKQKPICLTSYAAIDGFTADDQTISRDFNDRLMDKNAWMWGADFQGFDWAVITDYPNDLDGSQQGLPRATKTVNSAQVCVERSYLFMREEMFIVRPKERPMHQITLWYDQHQKRYWIIYNGYFGCEYVRPEACGIVLNALPGDSVTAAGGL